MLRINWMEAFSNLPRLILEEDLALHPREECDFHFKDNMFYHIQDNGIVRYFAHSGHDRNEGGFGGAPFTIRVDGKEKILKGPWSGRASYLSMLIDTPIADVTLDNGRGHPMNVGILVDELVNRWEHPEAYLLRSIPKDTNEPGSVTASLAPDLILKPNGLKLDKMFDYEVFAEPKK